MRNITKPHAVSFEEGLRNLASRLTGVPAASLPRTQEALVQFMAENLPSVEELTQDVLARLEAKQNEPEATDQPEAAVEAGSEEPKKRTTRKKTTE